MLARGETDRSAIDVERVEGLGAAPTKFHSHIGHQTLAEKHVAAQDREAREKKVAESALNKNASTRDPRDLESHSGSFHKDDKKERKREKKEAKKDRKKEKKAEKKERKREKKDKKREERDQDYSREKRQRTDSYER
jgi:hypothetical protein